MMNKFNHSTPNTHLLDTTFWQVLPAHYDRIRERWFKIPRIYHEASSALMTTDREAGVNSLKGELEMLEHDIKEYRELAKSVSVESITNLYLVAGRQRWRAQQIAKQDLENLEGSIQEVESKIKEMKADMVYGFEKTDQICKT
jgi:hypothetical protein